MFVFVQQSVLLCKYPIQVMLSSKRKQKLSVLLEQHTAW